MAEGKGGGGALLAIISLPVAGIAALLLIVVLVMAPNGSGGTAVACGADAGATVSLESIPDEPIAGYSGEQLENAAHIMNAAVAMGLTQQAQMIAVMTAMGESTLTVIDHGDNAGPDSRGLFQQRDTWGPYEVRMDPEGSARLFLERLIAVDGWEQMEPTLAAHAVQRNQDPYHYESHWAAAQEVVNTLGGLSTCIAGELSPDGWTLPLAGSHVTSPFGWRTDPISGAHKFHNGVDLDNTGPDPAGCGAPLLAAGDGTVSRVFQDSYGGWIVEIDHGDGVVSWTVHMERESILVQEGQTVVGGQQIAALGSSGYSTGCHTHYEIRVDGENVDPLEFLAGLGVGMPA